MKRMIRTNKWHAVRVTTERNRDLANAVDIRINSLPDCISGPDVCSAYLSVKAARKLIAVLIKAAQESERAEKRRKTKKAPTP